MKIAGSGLVWKVAEREREKVAREYLSDGGY